MAPLKPESAGEKMNLHERMLFFVLFFKPLAH